MKTAFYKSTFAGILYFPVTPFGNDGVNIALFRDLLSERLAAGPGAVFVACGTGEFTALSLGEYRQVVRAAMAKVSRTVPVFAGVGYPGRLAVEFAQVAEEEDVVGVLLMPTLFEKPTDESLLEHLRAILKCMKFPVILYQKGSVRLSPKLATILADEPNIIGIKDGTGDVDSLARVIRSAPDNWTFFNGTATAEISQLAYEAIGVHGYSSAVFAFHPEVAQKFYYAIRGGDQVAVADALKTFYDPFTEIRDRQPGYAVLLLKAGLRYSGHDVGGTRPPIQNPNPGDEADLFQLLASVSAGSHKIPGRA